MPDRDAFGRKIRDGPPPRVREAPVPVAPGSRPRKSTRSPLRRAAAIATPLVVLAVVGGIVWAAIVDYGEIDEFFDPPDKVLPTGVEGASLLRRANFAEALATLRESGRGDPASLNTEPHQMFAELVDRAGRTSLVVVDFEGELTELRSRLTEGRLTTAFDRIDPAAPERLVRGGGERTGVAADRIDNVSTELDSGLPVTWKANFEGGATVYGDPGGRATRVLQAP